MSSRISVTVTDEMNAGLDTIAQQQGISKAEVVRRAFLAYLESNGITIETNVEWGGRRMPSDPESE